MGYLVRFALAIGAGALFAGCGGSRSPDRRARARRIKSTVFPRIHSIMAAISYCIASRVARTAISLLPA